MNDQANTEPAFPLARVKGKRGSWWQVALLSGFGAGVAIAGALGLSSLQARGEQPPPPRQTQSGIGSLPPGTISLDDRLKGIEGTLNTLVIEMAEVKARLPKKQ